MNIRDLSYIIAVDKYRSFGRAAEYCHVSQPTLSGQIKKLEAELGVTLFERSNKSVHTTAIGSEIIALANQVIFQTDQIKAVASAAQNPFSGHINLGFIPTIAPYIIPLFVERMSSTFPDLSASYQENLTDEINALLLSGELDAAILATEPESSQLDAIALYHEPFWLVMPDDYPLAQADDLQISDIPNDDVLLLTEGHCFRDQALSICRPSGVTRQQSIRATSLETLINMVGAGQGVTLLPALTLVGRSFSAQNLAVKKINGKGAQRTVYLTYRRLHSRKDLLNALARLLISGLPETVDIIHS